MLGCRGFGVLYVQYCTYISATNRATLVHDVTKRGFLLPEIRQRPRGISLCLLRTYVCMYCMDAYFRFGRALWADVFSINTTLRKA